MAELVQRLNMNSRLDPCMSEVWSALELTPASGCDPGQELTHAPEHDPCRNEHLHLIKISVEIPGRNWHIYPKHAPATI